MANNNMIILSIIQDKIRTLNKVLNVSETPVTNQEREHRYEPDLFLQALDWCLLPLQQH